MTTNGQEAASRLAPGFAGRLLSIARPEGTEADFRREVARLLDEATAEVQVPLNVREEYHVARGRADAVYNRLVIEYERPGTLGEKLSAKGNQRAIQQTKDYILGVAKREWREAHRLAGVAMDGRFFIFVRRVGEGWSDPEILPVTSGSVERFLRMLFALASGAALIPENLIEDFGPKNIEAQRAVRAIYRTLHSSRHPLVTALFEQWRLFFSEATDYKQWSERLEAKDEFRDFIRGVGLDPKYAEPAKVFFALHTYYALLIKLIASLAAARYTGGGTTPFIRMAAETSEQLRRSFASLEHGGLFREYGIRNFLEGDFFGWYLAAWDDDLHHELQRMVLRLSEYDPGSLELAPEYARDLLKKLYHNLLPREIRHDLGEYYTPDWLAERLIRQTLGQDLGDPTKSILDPACGSGTFLVLVINHIRQEALRRRMGPTETLDAIRKNVTGFDLNPLAVIAARTNYILALGDLLKETKRLAPEGIDIPVYQCDSVLMPTKGEGLFEHGIYKLKTSVGVFHVPETFATRERMEVLANVLDESVEVSLGEGTFLEHLHRTADVYQEEFDSVKPMLIEIYRRLADLQAQGLNGVWARILKNSFAPLFLKPVQYVIGNPPWVNWENLPDEYRQRSISTWQRYGLFPHGGMDTILGKGKKDISMLMTYISMDKYLLPRGKLGFVLSQSLFKTSGAGQGFRRFILPDKTPIGPLVVEDMVELKPFEGATNRTSVAILGKGYPIRYPVPYSYWVKRKVGRGSSIGFDTPYEEVTSELVTFRRWHAEPVDAKDKTSAWITAKPKALRAMRRILGPSDYTAHAGSFTGGANAVYWVEIIGTRPGGLAIVSNITEGARRKVEATQAAIEADLLYPLLRGRDVSRWKPEPSAHIIMVQDPETRHGIPVDKMKREAPKAYSYFARFEKLLKGRAAYRRYFTEDDPFWTMFNVGDYTFSPYKVVWREQAASLTAAVVGPLRRRPVIPDHKLMMVGIASKEEAHYLCALLNSAPARLIVASYAVEISMDTHILENIRIPKFTSTNRIHMRLAKLSEAAHGAAAEYQRGELAEIEQEVDRRSRDIWAFGDEELADINGSLIDYQRVPFEWESAREATKRANRSISEEVIRGRNQAGN